MKKIVLMLAALLLFIPTALAGAVGEPALPKSAAEFMAKGNENAERDSLDGIYGHYAFEKQLYMNPLSSFCAFDGFEEYYTFSDSTFIITDWAGNRREIEVSYQEAPVDEKAFRESFMMEWQAVPDLSGYKEKRQYTLTGAMENVAYRLYLLDDDIWLARVHQDSANIQKNEYMWSIFKIARLEGAIPLRVSIFGTKNVVEDFLALNRDFQTGYEGDTCYNITQNDILENAVYLVFKYDKSCASFLMYEGEVHPLGEWFGGFGVVSMALNDLNKDGMQELYFTYSFGSGLHRSHIAYFDPILKQVVPIEYMHINHDMIVAQNSNGTLSLYEASFPFMDSFVRYTMESTGYISDIVYEDGQISLRPVPHE